jgi:hypothetical protein
MLRKTRDYILSLRLRLRRFVKRLFDTNPSEPKQKQNFRCLLFIILCGFATVIDDQLDPLVYSLPLHPRIADSLPLIVSMAIAWKIAFRSGMPDWFGRFMTPHGRAHYLGAPTLWAIQGGTQDGEASK